MEHHNILSDKDNKTLGFREVEILMPFSKTPTTVEITKIIADKYKASEDSCSIQMIKGSFGKNLFSIKARIYANKENKDKIEHKNKKPKKAPGAAVGGKKK
ncbi:MAG: hypothetical protein AABW73_00585 [Nanoarchaeota archaeon]